MLDADAAGSDRGITLTTCWPQHVAEDTGQRFVWHGVFIDGPRKRMAARVPCAEACDRVRTGEPVALTG